MKQKGIFSLFAIMMLAMLNVGCSSDDDPKASIVGTWRITDEEGYEEYTFRENGTGHGVEFAYEKVRPDEWEFTYSYDENSKKLIIVEDGATIQYVVKELTETKLVIYRSGSSRDQVFVRYNGDNNNNTYNNTNYRSGVVGKWVKQEDSDQLILVFNSDGTGTWVEISDGDTGTFVYIPEGEKKGRLVLTYSNTNETVVWYYMIENTTMFLYERGYGEELEVILTKTE